MNKIYKEFHNWLDNVLSEDMPEEVVGFAINLYESDECYEAELVGTPTFDSEDEDWACDDIFMSSRFEFPDEIILEDWEPSDELPTGWEAAQAKIVDSLTGYISNPSDGAEKLKTAKGIGVGFVDGNLTLIDVAV
jgi:shikimate kinase